MEKDERTFSHFLITRFNVPVADWSVDKAGVPTRDKAWMKDRLSLFTRYCVPSVAAQTDKAFTWLICVDAGTKDDDLDAIQAGTQAIARRELIFARDHGEAMNRLRERLAADPAGYVITSRLDNDDALSTGYVDTIQNRFVALDKQLLNIPSGLSYDVHRRVLTHLRRARLNPFTSLIERNEHDGNLLTVLGFPHHRPPAGVTVVNIPMAWGWLKIVHTRNVVSRIKGWPLLRVPRTAHFAADPKAMPICWWNTIAYMGRRSWQVLAERLG